MEGFCKDCGFWKPIPGSDNIGHDWPCYQHHGKCSCEFFIYEDSLDILYDSRSFLYWDGEGYSAGFYPGKDFGCIHFKARP